MKTEDKWIWGLLGISIIIIACTDFIFDSVPACSMAIYKLGKTFNNLSLAYISSVMFYWIVVSIPEARKKRNIYDIIYRTTGNVVGDCESLIREFVRAAEYTPTDNKNLTQEDFHNILLKIHPYGQAPMVVQVLGPGKFVYANWLRFILEQANRSSNFMEKLFDYIIYLESDYVKILSDVKHCFYFSHLKHLANHPISNADLTFLAPDLFKYYMKARELKEYANANLAKYSKGYTLSNLQYFP